MKLCLLCHTHGGVVVYEAGSDATKAAALLLRMEQEKPDKAWSLAVLHPAPK